MEAHNKIRAFLSQRLHAKGDMQEFTDSDSLVISRRLDSLDVVEIVVFLEQEFRVDFSTIGFDQQLVDSVQAILALVK